MIPIRFIRGLAGLTVSAAGIGTACAQIASSGSSVSISGRLDAGVEVVKDGLTRTTRVDNGIATGSRLIIEGTEDLGGGLKALFYLQHRFAVDTGAATSATKFWNFGTYVGLQSTTLGSLTMGRQYVPLFWPMFTTDDTGPLKLHGYGIVQSLQRGSTIRVSAAASPIKTAGSLDTIAGGLYTLAISTSLEDNMVVYKTPTFAGLTATAAVGAPEGYTASKIIGGNVEYRAGGFYGGLGYNTKEGRVPAGSAGRQQVRDLLATALYAITPELKVWGNIHPFRLESRGVDFKGRDYMIGLSYALASGPIWISYGEKHLDNCIACNTKDLGIGYHYLLSKRTQLYAAVGRVKNQANAANALNGIVPGAPGKTVQGAAGGLVVQF